MMRKKGRARASGGVDRSYAGRRFRRESARVHRYISFWVCVGILPISGNVQEPYEDVDVLATLHIVSKKTTKLIHAS